MESPPLPEPSATATALLSALAELTSDGHLAPPLAAGERLLRRGVSAMGAAGAIAHLVGSQGARVEIVEAGSMGHVPPAAVELVTGGEEAWLSTSDQIRARFSGAAPPGLGALVSIRIACPEHQPSSVAMWFDEERTFGDAERHFLRTLGQTLAREVDRASLLAHVQADTQVQAKTTRWAAALSDSFRLIFSPASLQHILDELARLCCETPADFSSIRLLSADRQSLEFRALHHRLPDQGQLLRDALAATSTSADLGHTACVIRTGKSLLLPTLDMTSVLHAYGGTPFGDYAARFPLSTVMVVPLSSRGSVVGVVSVVRNSPEPFQPADLRFVEEVADRAAAALDNANLLQELTRSEEQVRVALEAGSLGAWEWDIPAGKVTWSTTLERIHGLAPGSFGGTFEDYQHDIHPEDRQRVIETISRAVEERTEHHVVYRIVRPDGEVRWLEAHGRLLCDPSGVPQRLIGVCVDVTERRRSEEQLQQLVTALKDADQRKDEFLAMLAHELRNPLGPMLNATHLLRIPQLEEKVAARARSILERQVQHMARLLEDLLDVSRITRGKIALTRETLDVCALAREVVGDHADAFRTAGLELDLTVSSEPLFVDADRARLAQIVGNLLSNALKFSQHGQLVRVRVEREAAGPSVVLTVLDEGAGIEPAVIDSIFEPFVQADTSLSRPRGGLGLGLAVVKGLALLHGGRVAASSAGPGKGAELRVHLPLRAPPGRVAPPNHPEPGAPDGASATVLVFEDNADAAESLRAVLSAAGYHVWVQPTGRDATEVVERVRPAVVLCDLGLPDKDGYAVAAELRSHVALARLPLIAISGYGAAEDQARSRRAGFDLHLIKPVAPKLLLSELSRRIPRPGS